MQDGKALSLEQIREFLQASDEIHFKGKGRAEVYAWVARTLRQHRYSHQDRAAKGLLRQYLAKMTGLSRAQSGEGSARTPTASFTQSFTGSIWSGRTAPSKSLHKQLDITKEN
jgi:hypothetical protein